MRLSRQFHEGRFENTPPYVSNLSFVGETKAFFGDEVREPTFEVPVMRIAPADLGRPVAPGLRAWWPGPRERAARNRWRPDPDRPDA